MEEQEEDEASPPGVAERPWLLKTLLRAKSSKYHHLLASKNHEMYKTAPFFPKTPGGLGSCLVFPSRGGAFTKKRCRGPEKPFSEEDASTASSLYGPWDGDAEHSREDVAVDGTGGGALRAERGVLGAERLREGRGRGRDGDGWGALGAERSLRDAPVDGDGWRGGRKKLRAGRSWDYVGVDGTVGSSGCRAFAGGTWPWTDGAELWVPSVRGRTWPWTERAGVGAERLREDAAVPSVHGRMRPCAELWVRREDVGVCVSVSRKALLWIQALPDA